MIFIWTASGWRVLGADTINKEILMSDDPGHDAAEEILQTESDDHYGDLADNTQSKRVFWLYPLQCYRIKQ